MIEVGQNIVVRQAANGYRAREIVFPVPRLRDLLDEGEEERSAVLQCALSCPEMSEVYITGPGEFQLVWYLREDIFSIRACIRWPELIPEYAGEPYGVCAVNSQINCQRAGHLLGVLSIEAGEVYQRVRTGVSEESSLYDIIRERFNREYEVGPGRRFVITSYSRHFESRLSEYVPEYVRGRAFRPVRPAVYRVEYGWVPVSLPDIDEAAIAENHRINGIGWNRSSTLRSVEPEEFQTLFRQQYISDEAVYELFRQGDQYPTDAQVTQVLTIFLQTHDPEFHAMESCFHQVNLMRWRAIYSIRPVPPAGAISENSDDMDVARLERARRAERYRENMLQEKEAEELEMKEAGAKERAMRRERVAKEKQVEENKTGLRSSRPNIISDDDDLQD